MKSKTTTYVLIAAVLSIWGIIAWKLFKPERPEEVSMNPPALQTEKTKILDTLIFGYADPFLKERHSGSERQTPQRKEPSQKPQPSEREKENCDIKYIGYIRRGKSLRYIVESSGMHFSIKTGETVGGFRLAKVSPDSLVFTKKGLSYSIPRPQ